MLLGRERECERIDHALDRARAGRATALVLRGDAGIGKTALLEYAARRASGMTVVRAQAVESETEVAFAGLLAICRPLLVLLDSLPERQADALRYALGLAPAGKNEPLSDRLSIGAATLNLVSMKAETQPLAVIVDDANWLDGPSADALLFAARRLEVDPVAVILAARELEPALSGHGLEEVVVEGLAAEASHALLAEAAPTDLAPPVLERLVESSHGNPLALRELPQTLTASQRRGEAPLDDPLRITAALESGFAHQALKLGEQARHAILVAAASDNGDVGTIFAALGELGLGGATLEPLEDAGLVRIEGSTLWFRHPLVRSAAYHGAAPSERRRAHAALAGALAGRDEERRAWHRAASAFGRDEDAARALETTAERSRARAAYGAAANAYDRAARLGEDMSRSRRLGLAGDAAWLAGHPARASALLDEALADDSAPDQRAELLASRARIELHSGDQRRAYARFVEAADLAEPTSPERSAEILSEAVSAGVQTAGPELAVVAERLVRSRSTTDPFVELGLAQALVMAGSVRGIQDASGRLERALAALDDGSLRPKSPAQMFLGARAYWIEGRNADASALAGEGVQRARESQASGLLPQLLRLVSVADYDRGEWAKARAAAAEAAELADELGQVAVQCACLGLLAELEAAVGDAEACRADAAKAIEIAVRVGLAFYRERAERALGRLLLAGGELEAAAGQLEDVAARLGRTGIHELNVTPLPDLVEAYSMLGARAEAEQALARLEALVEPGQPGEKAVVERCRGIAACEELSRAAFLRALDLHRADLFPFELARTQLCFGERLRRGGERRAAREQLSAAAKSFQALGAIAWRNRAEDELRASGQRLRRREPSEQDFLTPREAQIAGQVAQGRSNREVAAALYLTPKTVEFHLTRIYRKLGVRSRAELVRKLTANAER